MTPQPPVEHAPWCQDLDHMCGNGTDCVWDPEQGPESGVVVAAHQSARDRRHRPGPGAETSVQISMSRNLVPKHQEGLGGADAYLVSLITHRGGDGDQDTEVDLTVAEAREIARRLVVACDTADADAQQVQR